MVDCKMAESDAGVQYERVQMGTGGSLARFLKPDSSTTEPPRAEAGAEAKDNSGEKPDSSLTKEKDGKDGEETL